MEEKTDLLNWADTVVAEKESADIAKRKAVIEKATKHTKMIRDGLIEYLTMVIPLHVNYPKDITINLDHITCGFMGLGPNTKTNKKFPDIQTVLDAELKIFDADDGVNSIKDHISYRIPKNILPISSLYSGYLTLYVDGAGKITLSGKPIDASIKSYFRKFITLSQPNTEKEETC